MTLAEGATKKVDAHQWAREEHEHYVEPIWVSARLFNVEKFRGEVYDPCCGFGRIPESARAAGQPLVLASDIVDRGYQHAFMADFLKCATTTNNIVCNPPFDIFQIFARHALRLADKVAMIWLVRRLNAARWLEETPLARVWFLTPRPSMPPGHVIARGEKPSGGKDDFAWLVWERGHVGPAQMRWLHRDK